MKIIIKGFRWPPRIAVLTLWLMVGSAWATFVKEDFEAHDAGTQLNSMSSQGWGASSGDAIVSNMASMNAVGTNVLYLPVTVTASNVVNVSTTMAATVWTECTLQETTHVVVDTVPVVNTNSAVIVGISTSGYVMAYSPIPATWVSFTNDVWGTNMALVDGAWIRLSILENFTNHTVALFANGHLLTNDLPFINTNLAAYNTFRADSGNDGAALLDNVWISNSIPLALTNDVDGDGLSDALEVQTYGSVYAWGATVSNTITLSGVTVTNVSLMVTNGATLTASSANLVVPGTVVLTGGSTLVITNGTFAGVASTTIGVGSSIYVYNGTATVNGVILTGTFTLDSNWAGSGSVVRAQSLNWGDGFALYGVGTSLGNLGFYGWGASSPNATVQPGAGSKAALLQGGVLVSNSVNGANAAKVWVDLYVQESQHVDPAVMPVVDTNSVMMVGVDASGWLVAYNRDTTKWEILSNDVWGVELPKINVDEWVRFTVLEDFSSQKVAFFIGGRLIRSAWSFISQANIGECHGFKMDSGTAPTAYLDTVQFTTNMPVMTADWDHDNINDLQEIDQYGSVLLWPRGSVFKIR